MSIDWTVPLGTILLLVVQACCFLFAAMKTVSTIQGAIDRRFASFELLLNTFKEGDIRELRGELNVLKTAQAEWIKALRDRTHKLADDLNGVILKVDRLENRPHDGS